MAVQMGRAMARRLLPSACPPLAPPIRPSRGGRGRPLSVLRGRVGEPVYGPENAPGTGREVSISSLDPAFGQAPRSREKQRPSAKAAVSDKKRRSKDTFTPAWWRRVDSNHRSETQQIYSLPPLATRELLHMKLWSWWTDSNPRPADYKSAALPAELHQHFKSAVQQQVLFYQKAYTLSTVFLIFPKTFYLDCLKRNRRWCITGIYGISGLLPPLRDVQLAAPSALCPQCGEEQYRWDPMLRRKGRLVCVRCAYRLDRRRRRGEKEEREP